MSPLRHVLCAQQFDWRLAEALFEQADIFHTQLHDSGGIALNVPGVTGKLLAILFYEVSTRTMRSFEFAALHMGMRVSVTHNARIFSSAAKGETLEDTVRIIGSYCPHAIVLRHDQTGGAERAAAVSRVPIINAGDGMGQHPTQALLDLYTIWRSLGRIEGMTVAMCGDLAHGRTVRSLAYLLAKFRGTRIDFISHPRLRIGDDIKSYLTAAGVPFTEQSSLRESLKHADVVYMTRTQKERIPLEEWNAEFDRALTIGAEEMALMQPHAILMHPLPRVHEISREVDSDPRAVYFQQAENGMYLRMALLKWVLTV